MKSPLRKFSRWLARIMPKGLYARSLIIIIAPMVLLQSVIAYVFMERHWQMVTERLSTAVVRDIAGIIDILETYPQEPGYDNLIRIAAAAGAEHFHPAARSAAAAGTKTLFRHSRLFSE